MEKLKHLGVSVIELTGGEPFTHPDFIPIVEYCAPNFNSVRIITNGYLLDDAHLRCFAKYKDKLSFRVDLHGNNSKYVDWFCGQKGAFENAKKAIKMLSGNGFKVQSAMNITPLNMEQILSTTGLTKELGANYMIISTVVPLGRGDDLEITCPPENTELIEKLKEQLEIAKNEFKGFLLENYDEIIPLNMEKDRTEINCGAYTRSMCFTPDGKIKMCPLSSPDDFPGCIGDGNLDDLLSKDIFRHLVELKDPRQEICGKCEHLWFCQGCLARGFKKYKEIGDQCVWGEKSRIKIN